MKAGDIIFSRWNGWDDWIIQIGQWIYSRRFKHLRPYWRWTHDQIVYQVNPDGTVWLFEARWPRLAPGEVGAENTRGNGLQASAVAPRQAPQTQAGLRWAYGQLGRRYSLWMFFWIGVRLCTMGLVTLPFRFRRGLLCSSYGVMYGLTAGDPAIQAIRGGPLLVSPMEYAHACRCPYSEATLS